VVRRQKRPHLDRARDLRKLLDMYAVTDESQREGYFAMAREGKQRAWWQSYGDVIPSEYGTLIGGGGGGGDQCYYATLNSTNTSDISDNSNFDGPETVNLSGVAAFDISRPCTWIKTG
jgi:hypothetical protein